MSYNYNLFSSNLDIFYNFKICRLPQKNAKYLFVWMKLINRVVSLSKSYSSTSVEICHRQTQLQQLPFKADAVTLLGKCNAISNSTECIHSVCVCVCKVRGHWQTHWLWIALYSLSLKIQYGFPTQTSARWWIGVTRKLMGGIYQRDSVVDQPSFSTLDRAFRAWPFVTATGAKIWPIRGS